MSTLLALAALAVLAGVVAARPLARWAARRTTAQPVEFHPQAEAAVLGAVLADPASYPLVSPLTVADFGRPAHRQAWQVIADACAGIDLPTGKEPDLDERIAAAGAQVPADLAAQVAGVSGTDLVDALIAARATSKDELLEAGEIVLVAGVDRNLYRGAATIEDSQAADADVAPTRHYREPGRRRVRVTGLLLVTGLLAAVGLPLTAGYASAPATALAVAALAVLAVGGVLWALVDHDTLYIDTKTFWPLAAVSWALVAGAAVLDGSPARLISGAVAAVLTVVVFEGSNLAYRLVRGHHGLGGGDSLLALASVGVPPAVVGSWTLGYVILMTSLVAAVAGWAVMRAASHAARDTPFAFGPYLATAWMLPALGTVVLWPPG